VPFGDATALESAITPHTAALLIEPIQGEGDINVSANRATVGGLYLVNVTGARFVRRSFR